MIGAAFARRPAMIPYAEPFAGRRGVARRRAAV
jgi:hypothetical protein